MKKAHLLLWILLLHLSVNSQNMNTNSTLYNIEINDINNKPIDLSIFKGKKILFVNVASECGFTPQYEGLQKLYKTYKDQLMIIGVPCNQFGKQESGTSEQIESFCKLNYGVTFLITEKIKVKGKQQHPLYTWLTKKDLNGKKNSSVKWNFQKYLVDEEGAFVNYWFSFTKPLSKKITKYLIK